MKQIYNYIIEKLHINKDIKVPTKPFYELSENELIGQMTDIIETYNKEKHKDYNPRIVWSNVTKGWRAQLAVNVAYTAKTCAELYYFIVRDYCLDEKLYKEVFEKYDLFKGKFYKKMNYK